MAGPGGSPSTTARRDRTSRSRSASSKAQPVLDLDGGEDTVAGYHSTFSGPAPVIHGFANAAAEMRFLAETVQRWLGAGVPAAAIAVLARRTTEQDAARLALQDAGVAVELLAKDGAGNPAAVKIASMHRAKGTEFSRVVVVGAQAGVVPLDWVIENGPEADTAVLMGRERSLFYVACSRARDELVVTWTGAPSPFLGAVSPLA